MKFKEFPLGKVNSLLESGPVILVATVHNGRQNVMPMSWHMMVDFNPPLVSFVMSDENYSFGLLSESGECVIAIPTLEIADKAVKCGKISGSETDKFTAFELTTCKAEMVAAPLIEGCYANLECRVADTSLVKRYGLFIVEVVKAWINPEMSEPKTIHHLGKDDYMVSGYKIKL